LTNKTSVEQTTKNNNSNKIIIRKGIIDLSTIDKNKNGKVYECPMDWNVISDKPGVCPLCGMTLKEYSIEETKSNLNKFGYEYKK